VDLVLASSEVLLDFLPHSNRDICNNNLRSNEGS